MNKNLLIKDIDPFEKKDIPDYFTVSSSNLPDDLFVVSRDLFGNPLSYYGEDIWDFSTYHPDKKKFSLVFNYGTDKINNPLRDIIKAQLKHVVFILYWLRQGPTLSIGSLRNFLNVLRILAIFAEHKNCNLYNVLENENLINEFVGSGQSGWAIETLCSLLYNLYITNYYKISIKTIGLDCIENIQIKNKKYRSLVKQHAPIPTRIYSLVIERFMKYLYEWNCISNDFLNYINFQYINKINGRAEGDEFYVSNKLKKYVIEKSGDFTLKNTNMLLSRIQVVCKLIVQIFSGMRDEEAQALNFNCIKIHNINKNKHYIINGRTTKNNNGKVFKTKWVTNCEGCLAIKSAQKIARNINKILPENLRIEYHSVSFPLFITPAYYGFTGGIVGSHLELPQSSTLYQREFFEALMPVIESQDIMELEHIDPHRTWRSESKFKVGSKWHLTSHQLRRSLALYAQRSGLVSITSLKRQLKHLTNDMSNYYAKGSNFAKNILTIDPNHFAKEWQDTQNESAAYSYMLNVLTSTDDLYGGHINWVENILKDKDGVIKIDRMTTMAQFKKGEISYKETAIGGCTKVGECSHTLTDWLQIDCMKDNCRNLIVNKNKLEQVIRAQKKLIECLDVSTIEHRTELSHLNIMQAIEFKSDR